jgi:hypothetical protein
VRIEHAKSLREVVDAAFVQVRTPFRSLQHLMPELRSLPAWSERRAETLVKAQLKALAETEGEVRRQMHRRLAAEWRLLPGNFPRLARLVLEESHRLMLQTPATEATGG